MNKIDLLRRGLILRLLARYFHFDTHIAGGTMYVRGRLDFANINQLPSSTISVISEFLYGAITNPDSIVTNPTVQMFGNVHSHVQPLNLIECISPVVIAIDIDSEVFDILSVPLKNIRCASSANISGDLSTISMDFVYTTGVIRTYLFGAISNVRSSLIKPDTDITTLPVICMSSSPKSLGIKCDSLSHLPLTVRSTAPNSILFGYYDWFNFPLTVKPTVPNSHLFGYDDWFNLPFLIRPITSNSISFTDDSYFHFLLTKQWQSAATELFEYVERYYSKIVAQSFTSPAIITEYRDMVYASLVVSSAKLLSLISRYADLYYIWMDTQGVVVPSLQAEFYGLFDFLSSMIANASFAIPYWYSDRANLIFDTKSLSVSSLSSEFARLVYFLSCMISKTSDSKPIQYDTRADFTMDAKAIVSSSFRDQYYHEKIIMKMFESMWTANVNLLNHLTYVRAMMGGTLSHSNVSSLASSFVFGFTGSVVPLSISTNTASSHTRLNCNMSAMVHMETMRLATLFDYAEFTLAEMSELNLETLYYI